MRKTERTWGNSRGGKCQQPGHEAILPFACNSTESTTDVQSLTLTMHFLSHSWKGSFIHFFLKLLSCLFSLGEKKIAFFFLFHKNEAC